VHGDAITLDITLGSSDRPTSLDPDGIHAFVAFDGRPLVLNLSPLSKLTLTYPALAPGSHIVRYGIYYKGKIVQSRALCRTISEQTQGTNAVPRE
jgi:hypothetical protein